jgi:hypothetical protein
MKALFQLLLAAIAAQFIVIVLAYWFRASSWIGSNIVGISDKMDIFNFGVMSVALGVIAIAATIAASNEF